MRLVLAIQRLVLRTERGFLRPLWAAGYALATRLAITLLLAGRRGTAYVCGGTGFDDAVYGASDVDLMIVVVQDSRGHGAARRALRRRWRWVTRRVAPLGELVRPAVYEDPDLADAVTDSFLTYGLDAAGTSLGDRAVFHRRRRYADEAGLQLRPGLFGPTRDWRRVAGRERRPPPRPPDAQRRRIAAWLELSYWWGHAFRGCCEPAQPGSPYLAVKLVAEPVRIWLWLAQGEEVPRRRDALRRGLELMPDEEPALRRGLELLDALRRSPEPAFDEALPVLLRLSERIAGLLAGEVAEAGATPVELRCGEGGDELIVPGDWRSGVEQLLGDAPVPTLLPLVDWRALSVPPPPDEAFAPIGGDPADPGDIRRCCELTGAYPALRRGRLLIMPSADMWRRGILRGLACALTDPVSWALAGGGSVARFPEVPGWSARDWARRAVAERRAWLDAPPHDPGGQLAALLTLARAALFLESIEDGEPELALTMAAVARGLEARGAGAVAGEAYLAYRAARLEGHPPPVRMIDALRARLSALDTRRSANCLRTPGLSSQ